MPNIFIADKKVKGKSNVTLNGVNQNKSQKSFNEKRKIVKKIKRGNKYGMGPRYRTVVEKLSKERQLGKFKSFNHNSKLFVDIFAGIKDVAANLFKCLFDLLRFHCQ